MGLKESRLWSVMLAVSACLLKDLHSDREQCASLGPGRRGCSAIRCLEDLLNVRAKHVCKVIVALMSCRHVSHEYD